jgi:hypothetical protein
MKKALGAILAATTLLWAGASFADHTAAPSLKHLAASVFCLLLPNKISPF